jgi:hypothetical protein
MKMLKLTLLVFAVVLFAAGSASASFTFDVTMNTAAETGQSGYLYMQYDPLINATSSTATVSGFTTNGTLGATAPGAYTGSGTANSEYYVTGTLPGNVVFANTSPTGVNDYNQAITFGTTLSFAVTLSTPASGGAASGASAFSLAFFQDSLGATPLYNVNDPNLPGTVVQLTMANNGTASETILDPQDVSPTPIPPSVLLFGSGLLGLVGIRRRVKI